MKNLKFFVFLCIITFTVSCGQQKRYIEYTVKEGETMRTIANNLDMKTQDLLRLNPSVGRKPTTNTVIVVPNKKMANKTPEVKEEQVSEETISKLKKQKEKEIREAKDKKIAELKKEFVVHEIKKGDTFYSLTRFYNLTQAEMISLNPILSDGLKIGQIIKIKPVVLGKVEENVVYSDVIKENAGLKVALLLPFRASDYDSISPKNIFNKSTLANIATDFYLGAEIAIDSLRKQGLKITLNTFDTERNNTKINSIVATNNLDANDVIIGPIYSEEAKLLANKVQTPIIYPVFSDDQSSFSSSLLVKTAPEKVVFRKELISYIKENFNEGNIIVVGDGTAASNSNNYLIKAGLEKSDSIAIVHVLKPIKGYIKKQRFLEILKPNKKNWVILTTNDNAMVADAINSLIALPINTNVTVFTADKGKVFDTIDNLKLAKIGFTYVSDEYVDEASLTTQLFNNQYFIKNNALPSYYATKGFDITYDVLMRLASGKKLNETFNGATYRVESKFDYSVNSANVTENKGLFIVKYNKDLSLLRLK